ncbi:hypothetical protein F5Y06DRAFT_287976 [Hypoxylon sp. FL0890]|nr:hypothetical protein F5Y06DRAFT_287976 [Hypoxylon sp. FL0890]
MDIKRLNDAVLCLHRAFNAREDNRVPYGLFGDYAITIQGASAIEGHSTDYKGYLECLAGSNKFRVALALDNGEDFHLRLDPADFREDCCDFVWSDNPNGQDEVRLRVWCDPIGEGWPKNGDMKIGRSNVEGHRGSGEVNFLDPVHLLKGRIRDAAMGFTHEHGADIYFLATVFDKYVRPRIGLLNLDFVGLALKNHPYLEPLFADLGLNMGEAKRRAEARGPNSVRDQPKDVWLNLVF